MKLSVVVIGVAVTFGVAYCAVFDQLPSLSEKLKRDAEGAPKDQNEDGKFVGDYNSECYESSTITKSKPMQITLEDEIAGTANTKCHWDAIGNEQCSPVLTCSKFKLADDPPGTPKEDKCKDEYLEITDGIGGYEKYCGSAGPKSISSGPKLREMYLTYKSGPKSNKRQLKCTIKCEAQGTGTEMPKGINPTISDSCNCGRKPNADRIVGGEDAKPGEFPWMTGLVTAKTRRPYCGGTIISDRFILTAAHCFKGPYVKKVNFQVLLGGHDMDLTSSKVASGQGGDSGTDYEATKAEDAKRNDIRFDVEKYYIHPLYVKQTNDFDIALIKLTEPIDFAKYTFLSPACMPDIASYATKHAGKTGTVAGWGLNASDATVTMGILQKLDVKVFEYDECKKIFTDRFTTRMMCAGFKEAGKDSCKGDSGGPLISEKRTQLWELIGVVSWGESCAAANAPGVYVKLNEVSQWVRYVSNYEEATWCSV